MDSGLSPRLDQDFWLDLWSEAEHWLLIVFPFLQKQLFFFIFLCYIEENLDSSNHLFVHLL